jgi:hypothetical protein
MGKPAYPPGSWVQTEKDGVWLCKVRDFAGHEAAAFALRETGKVLYLDLEVEKPSGGKEFVPAPKVAPLDVAAPPGTPGTIRYSSIRTPERPSMGPFAGHRGTYLGFEPTESREPIRLGLDALALLGSADYRQALPTASPEECFETVWALMWARRRELLSESIQIRPSILGEDEGAAWQGRFFAGGLDALAKLEAPEGFGDLALLSRLAREWTKQPTPEALPVALAANLGTEFTCWEFAPPRPSSYPPMEGYIEPRYGPFQSDAISWWDLVSELEPTFAKDVLSRLEDAVGETGVWIESAKPLVAVGHPEWTLAPGVSLSEDVGFGSCVSVITRHEGRTVLAMKLERHEPKVLALRLLKEAKSRDIGILARERAAGRAGLTSDWAKDVDSLQDFDPLEALQVSCDAQFLEELEALLPRTLKEARHRIDTSSIQQPIVVALGWIVVNSYDRARALLDRTPRLIRAHGVAYDADRNLSPYQQSLIDHARRLADREEPKDESSDVHDWINRLRRPQT